MIFADYGTKINVILSNSYKYPISAMCKLLNISSSSLYYAKNKPAKKYNAEEEKLTQHIKEIFKNSRNNYGSRKIKVELKKKGIIASKQRIRRIMKENGLVSTYTVKQYKVHKQICNNDKIDNKLKRNFNQEERMKVILSDLTYVNVAGKWNYICLMLDLYNREIVGYTAGKHKDDDLVRKAITTIKYDLNKIEIFHTDRGNEFKNNMIINIAIPLSNFNGIQNEEGFRGSQMLTAASGNYVSTSDPGFVSYDNGNLELSSSATLLVEGLPKFEMSSFGIQ